MQYLKDLQQVIEINSYTKNPAGVNKVGEVFDTWLKELGFNVTLYKREEIGHHRHYQSQHKEGARKLLLLGHIDTVFPPSKFEDFRETDYLYADVKILIF